MMSPHSTDRRATLPALTIGRAVAPLLVLALAALAGLLTLPGCGGGSHSGDPRDGARPARVVSLSPAITRTLVDLGLGDLLVGRSRYCAAADEAVPVVGDLLEIDYEALVRCDPTAVLVQPGGGEPDPALRSLAGQRGWTLWWSRLDDRSDVEAMIRALPGVVLPEDAAGRRSAAAAEAGRLLAAIDEALRPPSEPIFDEPTLLVLGGRPVMAFAGGTYLDDVLEAVGGRNAAPGEGWVELTLEDVARLDPAAVILVRDRSGEDDPAAALEPLSSLAIRAVEDGRLRILEHEGAMVPASSLASVARALRSILVELAATGPPPAGVAGP